MTDIMDKSTEAKVVDAVMSAIKLANDGMEPSAAVAKAAGERGFGEPVVRRMCEAFNVSKTRKHQKEASGEDRAASFPLADPDAAVRFLFPDVVPAPSAQKSAAWLPESCFVSHDRFFSDDCVSTTALSKAAEQHSHGGDDIEAIMTRFQGENDNLARMVSELEARTAVAKEAAARRVDDIVSYFSNMYCADFDAVEKAAVAELGEHVSGLMAYVYDAVAGNRRGMKRASQDSVTDGDGVAAAVGLVAAAESAAGELVDCGIRLDAVKAAHALHTEARNRAVDIICKSANATLPALLWSGLGYMTAQQSAATDDRHKATTEMEDKLYGPEQVNAIRSIRSQAMLADLLANDEVISRANPAVVIKSFNELQSMAPDLISKPLALRSTLRRAVEMSAMDPAELKVLTDMESALHRDTYTGKQTRLADYQLMGPEKTTAPVKVDELADKIYHGGAEAMYKSVFGGQ